MNHLRVAALAFLIVLFAHGKAAAEPLAGRTFDQAFERASPGAVIEIPAGTLGAQTIDSTRQLNPPVTFRRAPGANVTVGGVSIRNAGGVRLEGFRSTGLIHVRQFSNHIEVQGLDVDGNRVQVTGASDVLIENNHIHDLPANMPTCSCGVRTVPLFRDPEPDVHPARVTVRGNLIENLSNDPIQFQKVINSAAIRNKIRNAFPAGFGEHTDALHVLGADGMRIIGNDIRSTAHGFMFTDFQARNVTLENNVISDVRYGAILNAHYASATNNMPGLWVVNNTFWQSRYGALFRGRHPGAVVRNNIFDAASGLTSQPTNDHNLVGNAVLTADLELAAGSPGIDAGSAVSAPATDRLGRARTDDPAVPNGDSIVDIGAHERQVAAPLPDDDNDRVPNASDACPNEAGSGADGCPVPPTAEFTFSPTNPVAGQTTITFNAAASSCEDAPCTYHWYDEWTDGPGGKNFAVVPGDTNPPTVSVVSFSRVFGAVGTKYVRLRVTDEQGRAATVMKTVVVASR